GPAGAAAPSFSVPSLLDASPYNLCRTTAITTVTWLAVTLLPRPTDADTLDAFYRRVRPPGPGWRRVARSHPAVRPDEAIGRLALRWVLGCGPVYAALVGTGGRLVGRVGYGIAALGTAGLLLTVLLRDFRTPSARPGDL